MYLGKGRAADYSREAKGEEYVSLPQSGDPIDMTLPHSVEISAKGLIIPQSLEKGQWEEVGAKLCDIHVGMQWAIGDWWAYGYKKYGERKATAIAKKLPYEFGSLMNMGRVARRVTSSFRNEALSYSHHVAVAGLAPEEQKKLLDRAVEFKLSVSKLQEALAVRRERAGMDDVLEEGAEISALTVGHNSSFEDPDQFDEVSDLLKRARRAMQTGFRLEALDRVDDAMVEALVLAASTAAEVWSELATNLKGYQETRSGRNKSRSKRSLN